MSDSLISHLTDENRIAALRSTALLDSPSEEAFDRLSQLAVKITNSPVALVSLVDVDRQFFKSSIGLPEPWKSKRETPLSHSFCQHNRRKGVPLVVSDARIHPLLKHNKAIDELSVIAYLGIPLITPDDHILGSFCVIDSEPRNWTDNEISVLETLALSVMSEINLRTEIRLNDILQKKLIASERRYRNLYEKAPVMVHSIDPRGQLKSVSDHWLKKLGYSRNDVIGRHATDFLTEKSKADALKIYMPEFFRMGFIDNVPYQMIKKNGEIIDVLLSAVSEKDKNNEVTQSFAVLLDVTEHNKEHRLLLESEGKYRALFEMAHEPIAINDQQGNFLDCNNAYFELFGYERNEMKSLTMSDVWTNREEMRKWQNTMNDKGFVIDYECKMRRKNGSEIDVIFSSSLRKTDYGKSIYQTVHRDITEQKLLELEKNQLLKKLKCKLEDIKTLRGILPICSYCKKIRLDNGYWESVEKYICSNTLVEMSHGICPDCCAEHHPDITIE